MPTARFVGIVKLAAVSFVIKTVLAFAVLSHLYHWYVGVPAADFAGKEPELLPLAGLGLLFGRVEIPQVPWAALPSGTNTVISL